MKEYLIFWTYVANFASRFERVRAMSPQDAVKKGYSYFSDDFKSRAKFHVVEVGGDVAYEGKFPVEETTDLDEIAL